MTPFVREKVKTMAKLKLDPVKYNWFDISESILNDRKVNNDLLKVYRPPFSECMVIWKGPSDVGSDTEIVMRVSGNNPEEGITIFLLVGPTGKVPKRLPEVFYCVKNSKVMYKSFDEGVETEKIDWILGFVCFWYDSLSRRVEAYIPSLADTPTNRRRAAKGKAPVYEWRTVTIGPVKPKLGSKGGTHASPRLHDRRGHLRKLASGKTVWIRNCKVGHPNKGVIFHDYKISGE